MTIKEECAKRNIDRLFHFTPVDHLDSILKRGLLIPSACAKRNVGMKPNDDERFDGEDALCLSVEWPNWQLYWRFHLKNEDRPWALVQLEHRVMWEKAVCFNTTNAADNEMSGLTFAERQGKAKFLEMFGDCSGKTRADLKIPDHFTTNHQAEVLCRDNIETEYFTSIHLNNADAYKKYKDAYADFRFEHSNFYFKYRRDYAHW